MSVRVWKRDHGAALSLLRTWAEQLGEATAASDADVLIVLRDSSEEFDERIVRHKPVGLGVSVEVFPYTLGEVRKALTDGAGVVGVALREGLVLHPRGCSREAVAELIGR